MEPILLILGLILLIAVNGFIWFFVQSGPLLWVAFGTMAVMVLLGIRSRLRGNH